MLRRATIAGLTAGATLALAACAQDGMDGSVERGIAGAEGGECFSVRSVRGFGEGPEDDQIIVDAGRDHYLFETFGPCPGLDWSWSLAFDVSPGSFICDASNVDILIPDTEIGPDRCPVRMIRKLSEAEIKVIEAS